MLSTCTICGNLERVYTSLRITMKDGIIKSVDGAICKDCTPKHDCNSDIIFMLVNKSSFAWFLSEYIINFCPYCGKELLKEFNGMKSIDMACKSSEWYR